MSVPATRLIYDKGFQDWYLEKMSRFYMSGKAYTKEQALVELADSFNSEINILKFVLEGLYPNSRPTPDRKEYVFITEPIEHNIFYDTKRETNPEGNISGVFYPGRLHMTFEGNSPILKFPEEPTFQHGHLEKGSGYVSCWGGYHDITTTAIEGGFSAVLTQIHNFASFSRYGTKIYGKSTPQAKKEPIHG